jgi:hypothetical protein
MITTATERHRTSKQVLVVQTHIWQRYKQLAEVTDNELLGGLQGGLQVVKMNGAVVGDEAHLRAVVAGKAV